MCQDFIGKRGRSLDGNLPSKDARVRYAAEILQRELLPHVGIHEDCEKKKAYFIGYMVHRWAWGL